MSDAKRTGPSTPGAADEGTGSTTPEAEQVTRPVLKVDSEGGTGVDFGLLRAMYLKGEEAKGNAPASSPANADSASDVTLAVPGASAASSGDMEVTKAVPLEVTRAVEIEVTKSVDLLPPTRAPSEFPTRVIGIGEEVEPEQVVSESSSVIVEDDDSDRTIATEAPSHMLVDSAADLTATKSVRERPAGLEPHPADDEQRTLAHDGSHVLGAPLASPPARAEAHIDEYGATLAIPPESVPRPPAPDYGAWGAPVSGPVPPVTEAYPPHSPPLQSQLQAPAQHAPPGGFFPPPQGAWPGASQQAPHDLGATNDLGPRTDPGGMQFAPHAPLGPPPPYPPRGEAGQRILLVVVVLGCAAAAAIGLALIIANLR